MEQYQKYIHQMIAVFTLISKVSDAEQQRTKNKNQTVKQDARQVKMQNYTFAKCFNLPCKWNKNRSRQICAPAQFALGTVLAISVNAQNGTECH